MRDQLFNHIRTQGEQTGSGVTLCMLKVYPMDVACSAKLHVLKVSPNSTTPGHQTCGYTSLCAAFLILTTTGLMASDTGEEQ